MQSAPAYARTKNPGEPWRHRIRLTGPNKEIWEAPLLAATADGQITAAWTQLSGRTRVWSRTKPARGSWDPRQRVSRGGELVGLDVDGRAEATALVTKRRGRENSTLVAITRSPGGRWGGRVVVGRDEWAARFTLNPSGAGTAAWSTGRDVLANYRNSTGTWAGATRVDSNGTRLLDASVGDDGTAVAAWYRYRGDSQRTVVLKAAAHRSG